MKETHIRLDDDLKFELVQQAKMENRSLANLMVHAAKIYLESLKIKGVSK
jgi:predicted transcriptional regulator